MDVQIVTELEKPFSRFAERAVTTNDDNAIDTTSQRCSRFDRGIAWCFGFVGLILNAGCVKLFFNGGPQAPRTRGAVVDDKPCFDPCFCG
jgi:hypothetical protein